MEVIAAGMRKEDVDGRKKRNREEEDESVSIFERLIRDRDFSVKMSLRNDFESPRFARWLDFTLMPKVFKIKDLMTEIEYGVCNNELEMIEKTIGEMAKLFHGDPRLSNYLERSSLMHHSVLPILLHLIEHAPSSILQAHAAMILQSIVAYSVDKEIVLYFIGRSRGIVDLIRSKICEVQVQALCLLRTIALAMPEFSKLGEWIEEAVTPLASLLIDQSTNHKMLISGCETLAVFCQVYPQLTPDKLNLVLDSLVDHIKYNDEEITPFACRGLVYLCDGTEKMVVPKECFDRLFNHFAEILCCCTNDKYREQSIAVITALGAIVRWGSRTDIEVIIEKKALMYLNRCLYDQMDMWFKKNSCWIISNIIAKTENHIEAVVNSGLLDSLVGIIENCKFLNVKKEAAWAIANAIFGAEPRQIEYLKHRCMKPLWYLLELFFEDRQIVSLCLRALVRLEAMEVTCNGKPIDLEKIKEYLVRLQGTNIPLREDILWLAKLKKLRYVDSINKSDGELKFHLSCKIQEGVKYPIIVLVYDILEDVLMYFLG